MKKGCLIAAGICAFLIAGVAALVVLVLSMTKPVVQAGDNFIALLGSGKVSQAYESASNTLKAQQTEQGFEQYMRKLGLTDAVSASWSNRSMNNDHGRLEGNFTTHSGGQLPVSLDLVYETGAWKVSRINDAVPSAENENQATRLPGDTELKALALETLLDFNSAVQEKTFAHFRERISKLWRAQITAEQLDEQFKSFIEQKIDIALITGIQPKFDETPRIDGDGVLILKGHYPTHPMVVIFGLKYIYEIPAWKLVGIDVNVKPAANEK